MTGGRRIVTAAAVGLAAGTAWLASDVPVAAAGQSAGSVEIVQPSGGGPLRSGGSRTPFTMKLPAGAACRGDSAKAGYRIQSFLVPQSVDLDSLAFDADGPVRAEGQFRAPMYEATFSANFFVNRLTAEAVPEGGPGPIVQPLPAFSFAVFDPKFGFPFTPGVYRTGIACTLGPASPTQQEKHWSTVMTITADPADAGPARIRWEVTGGARPAAGTSSSRWVVAAAAAALVAGAGVLAGRRRNATPSRPAHRHLEETR